MEIFHKLYQVVSAPFKNPISKIPSFDGYRMSTSFMSPNQRASAPQIRTFQDLLKCYTHQVGEIYKAFICTDIINLMMVVLLNYLEADTSQPTVKKSIQ